MKQIDKEELRRLAETVCELNDAHALKISEAMINIIDKFSQPERVERVKEKGWGFVTYQIEDGKVTHIHEILDENDVFCFSRDSLEALGALMGFEARIKHK